MAGPLTGALCCAFQLPKPPEKQLQEPVLSLRVNISNSALQQSETTGFSAASQPGERDLRDVLHGVENSGVWGLNMICDVVIACDCSWLCS